MNDPDLRCDHCWPNGECDKVAMRFGWCAAMKLLTAIENGVPNEHAE